MKERQTRHEDECIRYRVEARADAKEIKETVAEIRDAVTAAGGGYRALAAVGTAAGALGAGVGWIATKVLTFGASLPR